MGQHFIALEAFVSVVPTLRGWGAIELGWKEKGTVVHGCDFYLGEDCRYHCGE